MGMKSRPSPEVKAVPTETVLVYGYMGQDGRILTRELIKKGISVIGIGREKAEYIPANNSDRGYVRPRPPDRELFVGSSPSAVYYLAANHSSSESDHGLALSADDFSRYFSSNLDPYASVLEVALQTQFNGPIFFASSSQVFGPMSGEILTEESAYHPSSLYAMAKAQSTWLGRKYREEHSLQIYTGILFNHESAFRPSHFLVPKVIQAAQKLSKGGSEVLEIGNLQSSADWSLATDFVLGFRDLLATGSPGEYIFASGKKYSVRDLLGAVFGAFGLDWERHVIENPDLIRRPAKSLGNASTCKLEGQIGWHSDSSIREFVDRLLGEYAILRA